MVFIVIDKSHCVLDWGEDFRPDFRLLCNLRSYFIKIMHMLAVTATAQSQKEIAKLLGMRSFVAINTTPVLNENVNLFVRPRIASVGGDNSVQETYNFVFKPLLLQFNIFITSRISFDCCVLQVTVVWVWSRAGAKTPWHIFYSKYHKRKRKTSIKLNNTNIK